MKAHLLRVQAPATGFAALFAAARAFDLRIGWLELELSAPPAPLPPSLEEAAGCGAQVAVAVGGGRSVALKPMRGGPVLRDLLREHFRGCALVLVRGQLDLPRLEASGEAWRVWLDDESRSFTTDRLIQALRRPRAFDFGVAEASAGAPTGAPEQGAEKGAD